MSQDLLELIRDGEAFCVEREDEEELANDGDRDLLHVSYADVIAHEYQEQAKGTVPVLNALEGVEESWQEDREVVIPRAPGVKIRAVESALRHYWRGVAGKRPRWMDEMKTVANPATPILKAAGFRKRQFLWNRPTEGGLIQVIQLFKNIYNSRDRPAVSLSTGIFCPAAQAAFGNTYHPTWIDYSICHFTWSPASSRPQYYENLWPLDEDCDSVSQEIAMRVRDEIIPRLHLMKSPGDAIDFIDGLPEPLPAGRHTLTPFTRAALLAAAGRMDEARQALQNYHDHRIRGRQFALEIARNLGLCLITGTEEPD